METELLQLTEKIMQCLSCKIDNPITSKFCSSCGNSLLTDNDIKTSSEVSLDWLIEILKLLEYAISDEDQKDNTFYAKNKNYKFRISLRKSLPAITISSLWNIKKPSWGQKSEYLKIANKANRINVVCSFDFNDDLDCFDISSILFLTEKISRRDIALFLDTFSESIHHIIDNCGIKKFA